MHKRLWVMLLLAALVAALAVPAAARAATETAKYTVMVYMNGSDLESENMAASGDLIEMAAVGSRDDINIVVETMGTAQWHLGSISNERNQRYVVRSEALELVDDTLGSRSVADPAALTDFIVWSMQNYPAERYFLVLWNHGGGSVTGFGVDELHGHSSLNLAGIQKGIADAYATTGQQLELVGFDACLMATAEVAGLLAPYARYLVASEELEPGHGWNYTHFLEALVQKPDMDGAQLGQAVADGFKQQATEAGTAYDITLSVVDLSRIDEVITALEEFVKAAGADLTNPARLQPLAEARQKAESYGNDPKYPTDMVDLGDLAREAAAAYPDEANQLMKAVEEAVVYKITSIGKPDATGLSVFLPYADKANYQQKLEAYQANTPFSPAYQEFAVAFAKALFEAEHQPIQYVAPAPVASQDGEETLVTVTINPEDAARVSEAYFVLAHVDPENPDLVIELQRDNLVEVDKETGKVSTLWDGYAWTIDGNFIYLEVVNDDFETSAEFVSPVLLNGEEVVLLIVYSYPEEKWSIVGAWPGVDANTGMAQRDIIPLKTGDKILPLFWSYNQSTEEQGWVEGYAFEVSEKMELFMTPVPAGEYLIGFDLVDYAGNTTYSDWTLIPVEETEPPAEEPEPPTFRKVQLQVGSHTVQVDGQAMEMDVAPQIIEDRTMVPLRFLGEALGADIGWNPEEYAATYSLEGNSITVWIGRNEALVNGEMKPLDVAPVLVNDRTLVPLRFISENLGAKVEWFPEDRSILVTYPNPD